jgi:hypothetical protein
MNPNYVLEVNPFASQWRSSKNMWLLVSKLAVLDQGSCQKKLSCWTRYVVRVKQEKKVWWALIVVSLSDWFLLFLHFFYQERVVSGFEAYSECDRVGASFGLAEVFEWEHAIFCQIQW